MTQRLRICYAGTYERAYPRNDLLIAALRECGARVEEAHAPVFERQRDKSGLGVLALLSMGVSLVVAYLRLIPDVALRLLRCDALMVGYIGQADMLVLAPVARMMRRPVIFNPLVTLTDTLVEDRKRFRDRSFVARVIGTIDRASLHLADRVIVDTPQNATYLHERFRMPTDRVLVVPVGADDAVFSPGCLDDPPPTAGTTLDVLFYGKFIPLHGIVTIVRAAALLEQRRADVRIELVGTGQTWVAMRALAECLDVTCITWTDWLPPHHLAERLRTADISLGIFDGAAKAGRVIPNKVHQSLACGTATITRDSPAARTMLDHDRSALLIPPDDPVALADAIERLRDPIVRHRIAAGGRDAYASHASAEARARQVEPLLTWLTRLRDQR